MVTPPEPLPDDIAALQTALTAERAARQQAEARASGAEAMVAYLKLLIVKMKRERFGQSAERGRRLLDQLELQLEELQAGAILYGSPEISGRECRFDLGHIIGATYKAGEAGAQATAQSERIRPWLVANRFQAISQASMTSARLGNTELASQWLRR